MVLTCMCVSTIYVFSKYKENINIFKAKKLFIACASFHNEYVIICNKYLSGNNSTHHRMLQYLLNQWVGVCMWGGLYFGDLDLIFKVTGP